MRSLLMITILALGSFLANAQFDLGIKGGINTSKVITNAGSFKTNFQESLDNKTGYVFGAYAIIGKKFFLQPEVLFASKGGKVNVVPLSGGSPLAVDIKTNNLDVPVLIGYKFLKKIRVYAGPVASFKLNEDEKFASELKKITNNVDEAFENSTFGYQAGIGVKLLGFHIDLRKDGSLSDVSSGQFNTNAFSQRLSGWQISLGKVLL